MSTDPALDRASFEKFLASAFAVQQSGLDSHSLSALVELHRSIMTGEPDVDRTLHMVADRARTVANATGVAVAQLVANQLVYRAGSGSAAAYVGRHVPAVLSASAPNQARGEILRVENAQNDTRIEAEVCRLFGASALLIVPIYRERAVAGVLEVFFSEAHTFQDREVLTYRVMARLAGEAMFPDARLEQKKAVATQLTASPPAMEPAASAVDKLHGNDEFAIPPVQRAAANRLRWNVAAAGLAAVLMSIGWLVHHHRLALPTDASSLQRSNAVLEQVSAKPSPASSGTSSPETPAGGAADRKAAGSGFKRVLIGPNEVDYIADDVTIRHFTSKPARPQMRVGEKQVNFGKDVTVRYFVSKPPVASHEQPVPAAERSADR
jgi:GAF domain